MAVVPLEVDVMKDDQKLRWSDAVTPSIRRRVIASTLSAIEGVVAELNEMGKLPYKVYSSRHALRRNAFVRRWYKPFLTESGLEFRVEVRLFDTLIKVKEYRVELGSEEFEWALEEMKLSAGDFLKIPSQIRDYEEQKREAQPVLDALRNLAAHAQRVGLDRDITVREGTYGVRLTPSGFHYEHERPSWEPRASLVTWYGVEMSDVKAAMKKLDV